LSPSFKGGDGRPWCEKFRYDRLRNDRALGNGKSDNNKNPKKKNNNNNINNVRGHWGPVSGSNNILTQTHSHRTDEDTLLTSREA